MKRNDNHAEAHNNLGLILENAGQLEDALSNFRKAREIDREDETYDSNCKRVEGAINRNNQLIRELKDKGIREIAKDLNLDGFESIGYNENLVDMFFLVNDEKVRSLLLRDLGECVVCLLTRQLKSATIMCGSIIEALLIWGIEVKGIKQYDLSKIPDCHIKPGNYKVNEMNLNQLLSVASNEKLINKNSYHLAHYIRDYRNIIHPNKEISSGLEVTEENVKTMWILTKKIIQDILIPPTPRTVDPTTPTTDV